MAKPKNLGLMIFMGPERSDNREVQTFTCCHCQHVGYVGQHDGGMCRKCMKLICKKKQCHDTCVPFMKAILASLSDKFRR